MFHGPPYQTVHAYFSCTTQLGRFTEQVGVGSARRSLVLPSVRFTILKYRLVTADLSVSFTFIPDHPGVILVTGNFGGPSAQYCQFSQRYPISFNVKRYRRANRSRTDHGTSRVEPVMCDTSFSTLLYIFS